MTKPRVITMSATYGAGGSLIAPRLADALGVPFADRLLTTDVTDTPDEATVRKAPESATKSEMGEKGWGRFLDRLALLTGGMSFTSVTAEDVRRPLRETVEQSIGEVLGTGGLILGRAATLVLADEPDVFHVRLDGPADRRVRRGMAIEKIDEATAKHRLDETDRARDRYVDRLYGRRADDPSLYHLMLDATVFSIDGAVALLQTAAESFWAKDERG